ncbi:unnamed protein product [Didymodactylos carnosus]|uniref:Pentapeptide repeat-containing protein n=1 Tax=Didymodactylos carnosus TaxID=1234261 RepID=A0A816ANT3_9BILA|nr:unnamed protein product [Didymodactylos carnosus]CAF1599983.1 unnamed protein product [Didymodactylos carnosus]CAF4227166.1 unnamed protein product [Didymodactylos carnosus]CAF4476780.1 unnamed protein product [Didymodactylos carnosus]
MKHIRRLWPRSRPHGEQSATADNQQEMPDEHSASFLKLTKLLCSALIPIMIAVFTIVVTLQERDLANRQRDYDERQADNEQQEDIFKIYIQDISKVLQTQPDNRGISTQNLLFIRTQTLTALRKLDSKRRTYVFLFLYESKLIQSPTKLDLTGADFTNIHCDGITKNTLKDLHLPGVDLSHSCFINCYIDGTNFADSIMLDIKFTNSVIILTTFKSCLMDRADFRNGKMFYNTFNSASLAYSDFSNIIDIKENNFTNVNLTGTKVTYKNLLYENNTFHNSIMPNGTYGPIQQKNLVVNGDAETNVSFETIVYGILSKEICASTVNRV